MVIETHASGPKSRADGEGGVRGRFRVLGGGFGEFAEEGGGGIEVGF